MSESVSQLIFLPDEHATLQCGAALAAAVSAPLVIYLHGGLGAGKTTLVRGLLRGLGFQGAVKSPTYTLAESYELPQFTLSHFDLYRFAQPAEWFDAGLNELVHEKSVALIEWPQQAEGFAPTADAEIVLSHRHDGRSIQLTAHGDAAAALVHAANRFTATPCPTP